MGKSGSFQKNPILRKQGIDPLNPFARITAAALQNKPFFILHTAKVLHRDILNFHRFLLVCDSLVMSRGKDFGKRLFPLPAKSPDYGIGKRAVALKHF